MDDLTIPGGDVLCCCKELADELGRHPSYIYAMRRDGFVMPGGLSTVNAALGWLGDRPGWRKNTARD